LEVLEEDVENLVLPHRELEIVLGIARCRGVLAASALPALRLLDLIARKEIAISREHEIARPALFRIEPETRLLGALRRDADLAVFGDVGDARILERLLHRFADLRARATQETLPVGKALALGVQAPVDEIGHGTLRPAARATPPCSPAYTTQRGAAPAVAYSRAPSCASRTLCAWSRCRCPSSTRTKS